MHAIPQLKLISFDTCPYVERSRIVLEHKQMPFETEYVSLRDKPAWLFEISPQGKVPVLLVDGAPIFESMVINELLEELFPFPAMLPDDPLERADARAWVIFCNDVLMAILADILFRARAEQAKSRALERLHQALLRLEDRLARRPHQDVFFHPGGLGLVDAAFAPVFTRWPILAELGYPTTILDDMPHLARYRDALVSHPSVQRAQTSDLLPRMREDLAL